MKQAVDTHPPADESKLERRIAHEYFVRFHMSLILAAVISSGVLSSRLMMELGVSLHVRYPIAVLASYLVFLLLVRVWIWYVSLAAATGLQAASRSSRGGGSSGSFDPGGGGSFDIGGGGSSGGGFSGFGGGTSGGGGASSSWDAGDSVPMVPAPSSMSSVSSVSSSSGSSGTRWFPDFDFDFGDDGWVIVLLIALVGCILGGGIYLVYAAPHILPEAAGQVLLAGTLKQASKQQHHTWVDGVFRSTWIPFVMVLLMAGALGWEAHRHCPAAHRLLEVLACPAR